MALRKVQEIISRSGGRAVDCSSLASLVPEFRAGEALELLQGCLPLFLGQGFLG